MSDPRAIVFGAGMGGLCAAIDLACAGYAVTVFEKAETVGGKMREVRVGDVAVDSGPTVLTMPWVFEALFEAAGRRLADYITLQPLEVLARHAWPDGGRLDLFRESARSADAIGAFVGAREMRGYLAFCADAQRMYNTLRASFLEASRPNPLSLAARIGFWRLGDLLAIRPFDTMWRALGDYFSDERLKQLFARYATYCGSSPFEAPATLMLIAHVEQRGVWCVEGGMQRLAEALRALAEDLGVRFRLGEGVRKVVIANGRATGVETSQEAHVSADAIVCNADPAALAGGILGQDAAAAVPAPQPRQRSLSALTWSLQATARNFPLSRHTVFFSRDYAREFAQLRTALPEDPTIYICAQDRNEPHTPTALERLFILVNAPPLGDDSTITQKEIDACEARMLASLQHHGLHLEITSMRRTSPHDFNSLFPATGGALYGRATHGWAASFLRPEARTRIPGLYLAGGGVHPGAGVPMTALSGRLAARQILEDRISTSPSRRVVMPGGTSTPSAKTAAKH